MRIHLLVGLRVVAVAALALAAPCWALPAFAQNRLSDDQKKEITAKIPKAFSGTIKSLGDQALEIQTAGNELFNLHIFDNHGEVVVKGKAKFPFLRTGLFIRFSAEQMDKKGNASGAISELAIVTPSETVQVGVNSDSLDEGQGPWLVVGQIRQLTKTGKATISAGQKSVKVQLPVEEEYELEFRDFSVLQEGDAVSGMVHEITPYSFNDGKATTGVVVASEIEFKLANTVEAAPKKGKKPVKKKPAKGKEPDPFNMGN